MTLGRDRTQSGVANAGAGHSAARRRAKATASHVLSGRLAWIERDGQVLVLRVEDTNRRGRAFRGHTVTVDVRDATVSAPDRNADGKLTPGDLLPGERITVRANLPRQLPELPQSVIARAVVAHDHSA